MSSHPCTLIVESDIRRLHQCQDAFLQSHPARYLAIGRGLSQALLEVPLQERTRAAREWLETAIREKAPGPVFCADTDILFEPSLQLDPLALFRHISRVVPMVVFWAGIYQNGVLTYAVPEHGHYRIWRKPEVEIKGVADVLS
jgi:hypothetical protein